MIKMVLADFYAQRKEALKKSCGNVVLSTTYLMMWFYSFWHMGMEKRLINITQFLVLFLVLLLHAMYPNNLATAMFLIPVSEKERKNYLYTAYGVKLVLTTGIHIICNSLLVALGKMIWWQAILLVLVLLLWSMVVGMSNYRFADPLLHMNRGKVEDNGFRRWISYIVSAFGFFVLLATDGKEIMFGWEFVLIAILVIVEFLLCFWNIKKDLHTHMERGTNYEKTMALVANGSTKAQR